jgi:hypothetical protein
VTKDERKKQRRKADRARGEADKRAEYLAARQRREQARGRVSSVLLTGLKPPIPLRKPGKPARSSHALPTRA